MTYVSKNIYIKNFIASNVENFVLNIFKCIIYTIPYYSNFIEQSKAKLFNEIKILKTFKGKF